MDQPFFCTATPLLVEGRAKTGCKRLHGVAPKESQYCASFPAAHHARAKHAGLPQGDGDEFFHLWMTDLVERG